MQVGSYETVIKGFVHNSSKRRCHTSLNFWYICKVLFMACLMRGSKNNSDQQQKFVAHVVWGCVCWRSSRTRLIINSFLFVAKVFESAISTSFFTASDPYNWTSIAWIPVVVFPNLMRCYIAFDTTTCHTDSVRLVPAGNSASIYWFRRQVAFLYMSLNVHVRTRVPIPSCLNMGSFTEYFKLTLYLNFFLLILHIISLLVRF